MASSIIVPVVEIKNVREHPNASMLGLADVLGFQVVVGLVEDPNGEITRLFKKDERDDRGNRVPVEVDSGFYSDPDVSFVGRDVDVVSFRFRYKDGDKAIYFPADTLIPNDLAEKLNVKHLLAGKEQNRVKRVRLRGEPSFGLLAEVPEGVDWEVGFNAAEYFGAEKYIPPIRCTAEDAEKYDEKIDPFVQKFTDIENGRIFTDVFQEGEEVVVSEKLHGTNCKNGIIKDVGVFSGSMTVRRKRPKDKDGEDVNFDSVEMKNSTYWHPWSIDGVQNLINLLVSNHQVVTLYGEVFGGSIQDLHYGIPKGNGLGYRAFGLSVDGKYVDWDEFESLCNRFGVPMVPVLYRGPFSMKKIKELAEGKSTLADHIKEGVVVTTIPERRDPKIDRAILKYISTEYDLSKHKQKDTTDV